MSLISEQSDLELRDNEPINKFMDTGNFSKRNVNNVDILESAERAKEQEKNQKFQVM